jgi:hypothetical protein
LRNSSYVPGLIVRVVIQITARSQSTRGT